MTNPPELPIKTAASSAIKTTGKRMKVKLTFLAGTRRSNQNTKLQRQPSGFG